MELLLKSVIGLLPVSALVVVLHHLDSHRLLGTRFLAKVFAAGGIVAVLCGFLNGFALDSIQVEFSHYSRYIAPVIEECLKAAILIFLFQTHRIGFLVDAGILGFTVGAGFSFVENLHYLTLAHDAHYGIWAVRGFGTAIMHGGATALFAILAQLFTERHLNMNPLYYLPGLIAAVLLHSIFNHFPVSPILATAVTLLVIPTILFLLFERNEVSIHNFLESDFESHKRLLRQIEHGEFTGCEAGRFLRDLERILPAQAARDMMVYFRLHTELVISAEGLLLARERGVEVVVDGQTRQKITEMHTLERHIGRSALHTMGPHLHFTAKEMWEIHLLEDEALNPH